MRTNINHMGIIDFWNITQQFQADYQAELHHESQFGNAISLKM